MKIGISALYWKIREKLGIVSLRRPPSTLPHDTVLDHLMVFHYCREAKTWRYDRHYDYLSKNEHFVCGGCGQLFKTRRFIGGTLFFLRQCSELAEEKKMSFLWFYIYALFGFDKYLPEDRGGKTTGELEHKATMDVAESLISVFRDLPFK